MCGRSLCVGRRVFWGERGYVVVEYDLFEGFSVVGFVDEVRSDDKGRVVCMIGCGLSSSCPVLAVDAVDPIGWDGDDGLEGGWKLGRLADDCNSGVGEGGCIVDEFVEVWVSLYVVFSCVDKDAFVSGERPG